MYKKYMQQIVEIMMTAEKLKDIFRTGWKLSGIDIPESVADHTFGVVFLAMLLGDHLGLDTGKMMKMAVIHDVIEAKLGDIHYESQKYLGKSAVQTAEKKAAKDILPEKYYILWEEYTSRTSKEAQIVAACDKLELYIQAVRYKQAEYTGLAHFWENKWNQKDFSPEVTELFEILKDM
jgi:putative hydrolase of HD superfamily